VATLLRAADALTIVRDARELASAVSEYLSDPVARRNMGRRALDVVAASRGAVERVVAAIAPLAGGPSSQPAAS